MKIIAPVSEIPKELCKNLKYLFADIDDTITTNGKLPASTFEAIWKLYNAGIKIVPVTGRPAGWCDHIARMWPVAGVVGENGAFYYSYNPDQKKVIRKYLQSADERKQGRVKLDRIKERVLNEVPNAGIASDQEFRIADLAIDFCEDVPPLSQKEIDKICSILDEEAAVYKISSIHINCWYGDYDKLTCFNLFLKDHTGKELKAMQDYILFAGDSQNDEPMFEALKHTIAVANIKKFLPIMEHYPAYVTEKNDADGFFEASQIILAKRK
ncbi:MAG: HAD-IIB family hydrolase [Spirochaetia bacterium]|jgi:HAD superfamily hydrolase (TIGR01484 family)|nr:HAD-IIB family hydrolase [Spirochaetia bacterium]